MRRIHRLAGAIDISAIKNAIDRGIDQAGSMNVACRYDPAKVVDRFPMSRKPLPTFRDRLPMGNPPMPTLRKIREQLHFLDLGLFGIRGDQVCLKSWFHPAVTRNPHTDEVTLLQSDAHRALVRASDKLVSNSKTTRGQYPVTTQAASEQTMAILNRIGLS